MRLYLTLLFVFLIFTSFAQFNLNSEDFEAFKRQNQVSNQSRAAVDPLMENYDVKFMDLNINATNTSTYHWGNVKFLAEVVNNPLDVFVFELNSHDIDSIIYNDENMEYSRTGDLVNVSLPSQLEIAELFEVEVYYRGFSSGNGMSSTSFPVQVMWTLSESFHAKDWFPVKQDLHDKIDSVDISITVPMGIMAGSNGLLESVDTLMDGSKTFNWKSRYPIVYYLISIALADYMEYNVYAHPEGTEDSLLIQNYIYNSTSYLNAVKSDIDITAGFIELFSEKFSLYPFMNEKYGHCTAPIGGGMEHQTMTTIQNFDYDLVSHELGHMWFGNNVTCATWQDIWINEGFASYTEYVAREFMEDAPSKDLWMLQCHNVAMSNPGGSIYIPFEDATNESRIFSYQLSYKKGAAIVHMLRYELQNDDLFFEILSEFQIAFKDSVATGEDFKSFFEEMSDLDLDDFFDQWYYGEGYPTYNVVYRKEGDTLHFTSQQSVSSSTQLFKMPMEYKILSSNGDSIIRVDHFESEENYSIYFPYDVSNIHVDPNNWVLDGLASVSVGIKKVNYETFELEMFPNPTNSVVNLKLKGVGESTVNIELADITGKKLKHFKTEQLELQINLEELNEGIYFLNITSGDYTLIKKVIKQ